MAQLFAEVSSTFTDNLCTIAGSVVFLYDSLITTGDEIQCFWGRKVTGAAILFYLNKYMNTLYLVWGLATFLKLSDESCTISTKGGTVVQVLNYFVQAVFTGIRVYALQKGLLLSCVTFCLSAVPVGMSFAEYSFGVTGENIFPFGCMGVYTGPAGLAKRGVVISRSCMIAADCIAIGATWFTLPRRRGLGHANLLKGTISDVLLVDGTVYFFILAILGCLHLTFTMISLAVPSLQVTSVFGDFTPSITAILISRFLLHLQSASIGAMGAGASQALTSHNSSVVFERAIGSLAASITLDDYFLHQGVPECSDQHGDEENEGRTSISSRDG
ncbi:hypothetical protein DICSQDRAFT_139714 [Dichomitus squalens LYAD-421 SS1]|uniref:DUF6533 domain-containing protein n=1 Tax=Dichomitus squalens (strain LYAD-421) TaxID=732165 RepID=R7SPR5_DICSQ|nr:uncharacterized protein DICSQDRAFT_139714 [Dichomitus squalens LYAD-421 SS1]EJF58091.1 hypothetical protein DICSQDRAFT_139714 [Dichomitus squalens LYAD-421 SS1]